LELLNSLGWTLGSFIFVLGIMIFVHELGHYLAAKWLKIRVDVFSLGFGPRLLGFRWGETDYRISILPLGGYVRMRGENFDDQLEGTPDEFLSRPKSHRFLVAVAGPLMNIILAVLLLAGNYMAGIQVPKYLSDPPVVASVLPASPAADAELQRGDRILSIGSVETPTWESLQIAVATNPGQSVTLRLERNAEILERIIRIGEDSASGTGLLGVIPPSFTAVSRVEEGPAAQAGLKPGDIIVSVASGTKVESDHDAILDAIASSPGQPLEFTVRRGKETFQVPITPVEMDGKARIGVVIAPIPNPETITERFGPITALGKSLARNYQLSALTFHIVGRLITGTTSIKMMSGPIEIARFSGQAASQGPMALIGFMSLISLQLGIFNLLPIPILDGGVIALLALEGILGRDLSLKAKERIFQVGFIFLVLLMSIVIFNDIAKII